jgi:hypothetical protein
MGRLKCNLIRGLRGSSTAWSHDLRKAEAEARTGYSTGPCSIGPLSGVGTVSAQHSVPVSVPQRRRFLPNVCRSAVLISKWLLNLRSSSPSLANGKTAAVMLLPLSICRASCSASTTSLSSSEGRVRYLPHCFNMVSGKPDDAAIRLENPNLAKTNGARRFELIFRPCSTKCEAESDGDGSVITESDHMACNRLQYPCILSASEALVPRCSFAAADDAEQGSVASLQYATCLWRRTRLAI